MLARAVDRFKTVYQQTDGSVEAAILELKRAGWTQAETILVVAKVLNMTVARAGELVVMSVAWE